MQEIKMLERWRDEEVIGVDCLVRNDNTVVLFNCYSVDLENEKKHFCFPICDTTTLSLSKYDEDIWTAFQIFCKKETENHIYVGGQGAMGNEGFLACLDKQEEPLWTLFFIHSNPFFELDINEGVLEAVSSHDLKFSIDLNAPENIKISNFPWK